MSAPTLIEYQGKRQSIRAWACDLGLSRQAIVRRLKVGWPLERALSPDKVDLRAHYDKLTHRRCGRCYRVLDVAQFRRRKTRDNKLGWALDSICIDCRRAESRQYSRANPRRHNARLQDWRKKNPMRARKNDRRGRLKYQYGLTEEQAEKIVSLTNGYCPICRLRKKLVIDHCHRTGKVRGPLCASCNGFLGRVEANPHILARMESYLRTGGIGGGK